MRLIEIGLLLMLAALSHVIPVFRLPQPTGQFPVGTTLLPGGMGGLVVQVWYPAGPRGSARLAVYEPGTGGWRNRIFRQVRVSAVRDAPMAAGRRRFPVLIYVNAWGGTRWENTALMEDLASHGFVVAASDQPAGVVDDVDLSSGMDYSSPTAALRTARVVAVKLAAQVRTARDTLDRLAALNADPDDRFAGRLDLARVGILGFSFGGATAAEAAIADPRFHAVVNLDGLTYGAAAARGVSVPYLEMSDGTPPPTALQLESSDIAVRTLAEVEDEDWRHTRANLARNGGMFLILTGSLHPNFSDYPMLMPLRRFSGAGPIDPVRASRVVRRWTVGFFDHALNGGPLPEPATTPEARVETWASPPAPTDRASTSARATRAVELQ